MPQAVQDRGGWADRDTAYRFAEFAVAVVDALGDRVTHWTTFNEPLCSSLIAYASGEHAPGLREPRAALAAVHHQHLAHGLAVQALRDGDARKLGITLNLTNANPHSPEDPVDIEAARRVDALFNRMYLEPVLLSRYPDDLLRDVSEFGLTDVIKGDDLEIIGAPIDFLGVNYYHDDSVSGHPLPAGSRPSLTPTRRPKASPFIGSEYVTFPSRDLPRTAMDWEVNPDGLRRLLVRLGDEYPNIPPLYVTENGGAYGGDVVEDGRVRDPERTAYILRHLEAVASAIAQGADVRGYFLWSLLDNFEWAWGFQKRFGIVHVDYETQARTIKDSGYAYSSFIRNTGGNVPPD
jgi:beta-glucosidase